MADDDKSRYATFKLHLPPDVAGSDWLRFTLNYRSIRINVIWKDDERQDLIDLLAMKNASWFVPRAHDELTVAREALNIDGDLGELFKEGDE